MGLAHLAIILTGVYRLLTVRGAEWRLIIIVVIVLDICLRVNCRSSSGRRSSSRLINRGNTSKKIDSNAKGSQNKKE